MQGPVFIRSRASTQVCIGAELTKPRLRQRYRGPSDQRISPPLFADNMFRSPLFSAGSRSGTRENSERVSQTDDRTMGLPCVARTKHHRASWYLLPAQCGPGVIDLPERRRPGLENLVGKWCATQQCLVMSLYPWARQVARVLLWLAVCTHVHMKVHHAGLEIGIVKAASEIRHAGK